MTKQVVADMEVQYDDGWARLLHHAESEALVKKEHGAALKWVSESWEFSVS